MRILVVMDSFKGSMTSLQAGQAVKDGILKVCPDADVIVRPMADGGEGTCEALSYGMDGNKITIEVEGPFDDRINASYFIVNGSDTAIIESASACGITLVSKHRLDPMTASSYGLGEMISDAIERGCRRIIIGLGGVATNDGGIGMLQGLGFSFRTADDREAARGAVALRDLRSIEMSPDWNKIRNVEFIAATDVTNPLYGPEGASFVFAPQKGASMENVALMDKWMEEYSKITERTIPDADPYREGSGAAGGLGFAIMSYLGGKRISGAELIIEETDLDDLISNADMVISGEGRIDRQTVMGKTVGILAKRSEKAGARLIAIGGSVDIPDGLCRDAGIREVYEIERINEDYMKTDKAMENLSLTVSSLLKYRQ